MGWHPRRSCFTPPSDLGVAENLSATRVIGVELGLERWSAMLNSAQPLGANRYRVSLDTQRSAIVRGSRENEAWNLRTLSLMMRAGLIRGDSEAPPAADDTSEDEASEAFRRYITSALIEVTDPGTSIRRCGSKRSSQPASRPSGLPHPHTPSCSKPCAVTATLPIFSQRPIGSARARRWGSWVKLPRNVVAGAARTAGKSAGALTRGRRPFPNLSANPSHWSARSSVRSPAVQQEP